MAKPIGAKKTSGHGAVKPEHEGKLPSVSATEGGSPLKFLLPAVKNQGRATLTYAAPFGDHIIPLGLTDFANTQGYMLKTPFVNAVSRRDSTKTKGCNYGYNFYAELGA